MARIVLASASPRRRELLAQIGVKDIEIRPASADESVFDHLPPEEMVVALSRLKAETAAKEGSEDDIVIGSDTAVVLDGRVMGKPASPAAAREMISSLSGRTHRVLTGLCVMRGDEVKTLLGCAEVTFRALDREEIEGYCSTEEPYDKAGAYGIQGLAAAFAEKISGDYYSIVGLPLCGTAKLLGEFGVRLF
ncbi:MAG: septum formation inhibitor Maf [Clostridia bacterium]|nr:septum formation inhibitor Maf [Clostridia bacterium]